MVRRRRRPNFVGLRPDRRAIALGMMEWGQICPTFPGVVETIWLRVLFVHPPPLLWYLEISPACRTPKWQISATFGPIWACSLVEERPLWGRNARNSGFISVGRFQPPNHRGGHVQKTHTQTQQPQFGCEFDACKRDGLDTLKRSFVEIHPWKEVPDMSKLYTEAFLLN